ncbi:hypothetical protein [Teredinibacter sp. KSP-S5-2]|uniref:hypothetical protein n=1 Tax=Teredinibacter sp. KSP-S5-2 TaxID=3034506 RepID=UPI0029348F45|nr:hypothetical protein [Teredinibacter sp. KSP-S5-2]WNO08283.1 hypothetical protein P5V12_15030 [Teredinibacter sp. KSP-S5-2]
MKKMILKAVLSVSILAAVAPSSFADSVDDCVSNYCASVNGGSACHSSPAVRKYICGG